MFGILILLLVVAASCIRFPKHTLLAIAIAFIFQDAAVALVGGRDTLVGGVLQNGDEASIAAAAIACVFRNLYLGRPVCIRAWVAPYLLFLLVAVLSIATAGSGLGKGVVGLFLLSKGFLFVFAADQIQWSRDDARKVIVALLSAVALVALFAIPDLFFPRAARSLIGFDTYVDYRDGLPSVVSLLGHPGGYGWLMIVGALVALAHVMSARGGKWGVPLALLLVAGALSLRRKPVLGFLVASGVTFLGLRGRLRWRQTLPVFLLILALFLPLYRIYAPIISEGVRAYVAGEALTTQARTALYGGAVILARDYFPFGVGIGRYGSYGSIVDYSDIYYQFGFHHIYGMSPEYSSFIQDTFWPQVLGETGLFGLIFYAATILLLLLPLVRAARGRIDDVTVRTFVLMTILINIETLVESLAAPTYTTAMQAVLSLGLAGIAGNLISERGALRIVLNHPQRRLSTSERRLAQETGS